MFEEHADPITGLCSFWFVHKPALSVLLGRDAKAVLNGSSSRNAIAFLNLHMENFLGAKALTALMGKEWRLYRSAVHKSFTPGALQLSQSSINQVAITLSKTLLSVLSSEQTNKLEHQVLPLMKMATMDVFGLVALNVDFECCRQLQLTPVASAFEYLTHEFTRRLTTPWDPTTWLYHIPFPSNRRHKAQRREIRQFITEQIAKTRMRIAEAQQQGEGSTDNSSTGRDSEKLNQDLLTNILKTARAEVSKDGHFSSADDVSDISDEAIIDILMVLLFGGYDTTSITLSYALYLLASNPDIEATCLLEVNAVFGNMTDESIIEKFHDVNQLQYTKAFILETLRLFPPAPLTTRTLEKPLELHGHVFAKGTDIHVPIWSIQRDARNFPKPMEVKPERWVRRSADGFSWEERPDDDRLANEIPPANFDAFCAFSAGARNCVGRKLALQEAVTLLALLIRKIKFRLTDDSYEAKPNLTAVVQQPAGGLPMSITART